MIIMTDKPKRTKRKGVPLNVWISGDVRDNLDQYIDDSFPKLTVRAVVEAALTEFLKKHGKKKQTKKE